MDTIQIPPDLSEFVELAQAAAQAAAEQIMPHFGARPKVQTKQDGSPVTIADKNAEQAILKVIRQRRPDDGYLGEEFGSQDGTSEYRWIIDPIDGTVAFVHAVPLFGTLLALQKDGQTILGLINMPALNEMVLGIKGLGTFHNGQPCRVSQISDLSQATILTSNFNNLAKHGRKEGFDKLISQAGEARTWGDCYGYLLVATGRAEIMIDPIVAAWDIAPMLPIISEAGGQITDLHGKADCQMTNALATNGRLHAQALAAFHQA